MGVLLNTGDEQYSFVLLSNERLTSQMREMEQCIVNTNNWLGASIIGLSAYGVIQVN